MSVAHVTVEGYIVRRQTDRAVALVKEGAGWQAELIWVPRASCHGGEILEVGDTDLQINQNMADEKGLDY